MSTRLFGSFGDCVLVMKRSTLLYCGYHSMCDETKYLFVLWLPLNVCVV